MLKKRIVFLFPKISRIGLAVFIVLVSIHVQAQTIETELQSLTVEELVREVRHLGDATRGAIVFHQPSMACAKCHAVDDDQANRLGPNLSMLAKDVSDEEIIESVLYPSKAIRRGYESISVLTVDGKVISAFLEDQTQEGTVLRDVARDGELVTIASEDIELIKTNETSIMPVGQVNQLSNRQQFFDLIRYLIEIRDGGPERALQLQPSPSLLVLAIPDYENHIDHAGLIREWNIESYQRGEAIYQRVCANCHGTHDQPGSLPTSLRFAEDKFKNGSDPWSMYRTLTHGFGQMAAQSWMVPSQKYDVIHYIRQAYLETHNPMQFAPVDSTYLAGLPKGDTFGPEPSNIEVWSAMDYGPSLIHTYEIPGPEHNLAYKGLAVRLDPGPGGIARGRHWMVFDTDTLRVAAGWSAVTATDAANNTNNFVDWRAIQFNGEHGIHPKVVGQIAFQNPTGPGWAKPGEDLFLDNQRVLGRDGRQYGPLPKEWGQFRGLYHHDQQVVISYSVGGTEVLELPRLVSPESITPFLVRTFNLGARPQDLILQVARHPDTNADLSQLYESDWTAVRVERAHGDELIAGFAPRGLDAEWQLKEGHLRLRIPAGDHPLQFSLWIPAAAEGRREGAGQESNRESGKAEAFQSPPLLDAAMDLTKLTRGGPARWPQTLTTKIEMGSDQNAFAVDVLLAPESNPWLAQMRFTGLDFYPDGRIAVCSWDGDVWMVTPRQTNDRHLLDWRRIASGLFQPLGLKIVQDKIHLICRDQLTVLHDLNGNGEIDFYECLNNDHQVTEHFHEFAMGLQVDADGNFYYAKSGCHGKAAVVPHHGTLLRVSSDGSRTDILANGFRAANGVCLNPDGSFVVTDQEGYWNPKNRINWVTPSESGQPKFYGNMLGYHHVADASDDMMEPPLCWITNDFDRSPAELLWVESPKWGDLNGGLLNLSYGYGKIYLVLHEMVSGIRQGGMIELPLPIFPTGVMRGRFHPADGQLYVCGMFAWAGSATHPGGLYRVRYLDKPTGLPVALQCSTVGIELTFAETLDPKAVAELQNYSIEAWDLKRTANYGSQHFNQRPWAVTSARLSADGKTLTLTVPDIKPTWGMEIVYRLKTSTGHSLDGKIHNTIHHLKESLP